MLERIAEWELVARAGRIGLIEVFRARSAEGGDDRPAAYAVKRLRAEGNADSRAIEVLRCEARVGRTVAHPNLIPVLAASVSSPPYFVVTPWLGGQTLAEHLALGGRGDLPTSLWIVRQVAQALDALHQAGWMHGDVKPANVFLSPEGHVTLLDLGFARRPSEPATAIDECVTGTYHYIAPEMITSAYRPDIRSDIYSLGILLYQTLSGRLPFEGNDPAELASRHRGTRPADLRRLVPQLPSEVVRLVEKMLAKEPLRRPHTPAELVERLIALEIETFAQRAAG